jgi:biopolymer transport protein ExbB
VMGGKTIGYIIWAISIVTVALIAKYATTIRRTTILPGPFHETIGGMFRERQYRQAIEVTGADPSFLGYIVHKALTEATHGYGAMERAMEEAAEERTTRLLRGIEWLNLIGNIGPMLGLLGTVWGMIGAFFTIAQKEGMPNPSELAGDIGVALVTTLLGLAVAIPALAAYAIFRNRIDSLTSEAILASQELILTFRPAKQS